MESPGIVIVGNGFDLYHGVKSSYRHYKKWLIKCDPDLYKLLERYIDVAGNWWCDFERNLGDFNIVKILRECPRNYKHQKDPRFPPTPTYPGNWFFDEMRERITASFKAWVKTLRCASDCALIQLPKARLYISFNYTDTLEKLYRISKDQILYIHGKVSCGDDLVFGHGKCQYELENDYKQKYGLIESKSFYEAGTFGDEEFQLMMGVSYWEKNPYIYIVKYNEILLPAVMSSDEVFIYGFSFSEVDRPYIEWIAEKKPTLRWYVSWHSQKDKQRVESVLKALGVKAVNLFRI